MFGSWIIYGALLTTLNLWLLAQSNISLALASPWRAAGQISALLGMLLISFSFILSTRWRFIETLFGGLDKVYKVHHISSAVATILLIHHPLFLVLSRLQIPSAARRLLIPGTDLAYNAGIFALWTLIGVILLTLFIRLPYHIWQVTHKLVHLALLFASVHVLLISSDISRSAPLRVWLWLWIGLAIYAAAYQLVLYRWLGPRATYLVDNVTSTGPILELALSPLGKGIRYRPGQFVYFSVKGNGLPAEAHPFSITTAPSEPTLGLAIKAGGDYTKRLQERLLPGAEVHIRGPFGRFGEGFGKGKKDTVMIAGGIGITPFISLLKNAPAPLPHRVDLLYCTQGEQDAWFDPQLQTLCRQKQVSYLHHMSSTMGYLTVDIIKNRVEDIKKQVFLLCGPPRMMEKLRDELVSAGVRPSRILYEDFGFK